MYGGNFLIAGRPVPASLTPSYSVHSIGFQGNFIVPKPGLAFFFKYYDEYILPRRVPKDAHRVRRLMDISDSEASFSTDHKTIKTPF